MIEEDSPIRSDGVGYPPRMNFGVSEVASVKWAEFRDLLADDENFLHRSSHSVAMEWVLWCYEQAVAAGVDLDPRKFEPDTKSMGRPRKSYTDENLRPCHIRKLAGIDSDSAKRKLRR